MEQVYLLTLRRVHAALEVNGYDPISQIVGYLLTGDPTYITAHANARHIIAKIDRYDLLRDMVTEYFKQAG